MTVINYFFEKKIILRNTVNGEYKVNRIIHSTPPDEIPIFGSSRAGYIYIPDSLGKNYFNYGLAGTRYNVTLFFMEQECLKNKTTPWVIANLDLEGLGYGMGDVSNYILNCNNSAVRAVLGASYKPYFSIPFLKYYGRYENYFRLYLTDKIELTKFTNKGASIDKNVLPREEFDELVEKRKNTIHEFKNDTVLQKRLFDLITAHPDRNFIFIVSPYHPSYFAKFRNMEDVYAFLQLLGSFKNVRVLDFSHLPLNDTMFLNTTHINLKCALVYNRMIRDTFATFGVK